MKALGLIFLFFASACAFAITKTAPKGLGKFLPNWARLAHCTRSTRRQFSYDKGLRRVGALDCKSV
jgi:hypothetical protein